MRHAVLAVGLTGLLFACGSPSGETDGNHVDAPAPDAPAVDLHVLEASDVSILVPSLLVERRWVQANDAARGGPLVPQALRDLVTADSGTFDEAPAVQALRVDPCFRGTVDDPCQPQVRLVLGPVFNDEAFHALYALTDAELDDLLTVLAELRTTYGASARDTPLGVNDILAAEPAGDDLGPYGVALRAAVLATCGPDNLVRLTHSFSTAGALGGGPLNGETWTFTSVSGDGVATTNAAGDAVQVLSVSFGEIQTLDLDALTSLETPLTAVATIADADTLPLESLQATRDSIQALEDPHRTLPDEVTCNGCHLAAPLRHALDARRTEPWPTEDAATTLDDLLAGPVAPEQVGQAFRIFSWWIGEPMITRRVMRETAEVLAAVRSR